MLHNSEKDFIKRHIGPSKKDEKDNEIGKVTSGTFGPSVNGPIAMGYIHNDYSKKNTKIFLEVRGKKIPASICEMPFYKKNYVRGGEENVRN